MRPTTIILFGGTGDLAQRELFPALMDLYANGHFNEAVRIVGFSKEEYTDEEYRAFARESLEEAGHSHTEETVTGFLYLLSYQRGLFQEADSYRALGEHLVALDGEAETAFDKVFYLAVPPRFYPDIFEQLAQSGLALPYGDNGERTRVAVEKPFGDDVTSARRLDEQLGTLFAEEQIFRIDHYLAKETLQNILAYRFSNAIFEPIWSAEYVEKVEVNFLETLGMEGRGSFYDKVGALRDVGQNHVLQLLAAVAMENPGAFEADAIREERARVFSALRDVSDDITARVRRAQYKGYRETEGVADDSETETFFEIQTYIDTERWQGVPFVLRGGKCMPEDRVEVKVHFKDPGRCLCPEDVAAHSHPNIQEFRIKPDNRIRLQFWVKTPGFEMDLQPCYLDFGYEKEQEEQLPSAYERVLFDCIRNDRTLFASTDEVLASWEFITPILEQWHEVPLETYEPGSMPP